MRNNRIWLSTFPDFAVPGSEERCLRLPESWIPDNKQGGVAEAWNALDDHFVRMLIQGEAAACDVESAFLTSRACFAAIEAARTNTVVRLDDVPAPGYAAR